MPNWGSTDILGLSGKQQASAFSAGGSGGATATATPPLLNGGSVDPSTGRPQGVPTPQPSNSVTPGSSSTLPPPPAATQNRTLGGGPPVPGDRWQGGAANPNGTQSPTTGRQTGGRYVDPTYKTDANGNPLSTADQQAWRDYDTARANASTREQAGYRAYKARQAAAAGTAGQATNAVYNPISQTWSMVDSKGVWTHGLNSTDLQSKLDDTLKKQYPDWWWGQYASQQNLGRRQEVDAGAYDAQNFAKMGQSQTRPGPTNF